MANLNPYLQLMRMNRPVGSLLLLWPTLAALWMAAEGLPPTNLIVIFTLGTFVMRSAGCVINDFADRDVDGSVRRTKERPLATGSVSHNAALTLFGGLLLLAGVLVLFLNWQTQLLAVGGLGVAILYPFMKRWTHLPQTVLGVAFSWGILMAWTATGTGLNSAAFLFFTGSVLWIVAYDTMYAMVDREDDLKVGVKSTAILFGELDRLMVGVLQICTILILVLLGQKLGYVHAYFMGVAVAACLFAFQQHLIRERSASGCMQAFTNNILVGFALFVGTVVELALT